MRWLAIIGIGEDGFLAPQAAAALAGAHLVIGGARHLALAAPLIRGAQKTWPSPITDAFAEILARRPDPVAVLASGDPYCYGIGNSLARLVPAEETICFPEKSAFSLACAYLGWPVHDCDLLSFCGRPLAALLPKLQPGARILALSADASTAEAVAALLTANGFGASILHVLEAMGGSHQLVRASSAENFALQGIQKLNLLGIDVVASADARIVFLSPGLPEKYFEHDGQLTKREVRAATLAALAPRRGEMLWDIGAGAGSVGIEWMLCHQANRTIAIERDASRAARAARNAAALGVPGLQIVHGAAPDALAGLPTPDAVFIGGGAHDPAVFDAAWAALRSRGRLVVNAVTTESQALLFERQKELGGTLTRLAIERLDTIGGMHGFRPAMAVMQFYGEKP